MMFVHHSKQAFTACFGDSFTLVYVDDARTSQETHTSTAYYSDIFTFVCR
jgi:hypothetical protein